MKNYFSPYEIFCRRNLLYFAFIIINHAANGQCEGNTINIDKAQVCKDEYLSFGTATNDNIYWDLCSKDLLADPSSELLTTLGSSSQPFGYSLVESEEKWFAFIANRGTGELFRIDYGSDLTNPSLTVVNLGNFDGKLSQIEDITIRQIDSKWFAIITNNLFAPNNEVALLNFGEDITNINPEYVNLGNFGLGGKIRAASFVWDGNKIVLALSNSSKNLTIVNFRDSFYNEITINDVIVINNAATNAIFDLDIYFDCGAWFVLIPANKNLSVLKFGENLFQQPLEIKNYVFNEISNSSFEIRAINENNSTYIFIGNVNTPYVLINAGNLSLDDTPVIQVPSEPNLNLNSFDVAYFEGKYYLHGIKNADLSLVTYAQECGENISFTTSSTNDTLRYSLSGQHSISLRNVNTGLTSFDTVNVTGFLAPPVSFTTQGNICISNPIVYTADDESVQTWSWTFGDGSAPISGQQVTHQYTDPGTYEVTLEVESANGCSNRLTKEITIYEPPVPGFSVPAGTVCTNGAVPFTNTTDARLADDIIAYRWYVTDADNNETLVSEVASPAVTFDSGGEKTVRLEAEIPGCTEIIEQAITVLAGPTVAFSATPACQGHPVTFTNATVGTDITSYSWDFADGSTFASVTPESPTHSFAVAGDYPVSLTVTNEQGCQNVYQQTITVYEQPTVSFLSEVACAGTPTQFTDASTAGTNANIVAWQWEFGDGIGVASIRNPTYAYLQAGTYDVKLITQSSAGCTDSTTQTVTVVSAVDVGFVALRQCPTGAPQPEARPLNVLLSDTSVSAAGETIDRWFWTVNGDNFVSAEVEVAFPAPGDYPVSLTVFTASGCNATVQRIVSVTTAPAVAFTTVGSCTSQPVAFRGEVDAPGWGELNYAWDFNGEGTATVANPEFVFDAPGTYDVTLTVQTPNACTFTTTQSVTVAATPVATFTASPDYGGAPLEVTFANASTNTTAYAWDFGGLSTSEEAEPTVTFADIGTYVVTLVATNAAGCTSTTQQTVEVVLPVQDLRLDDFSVVDSPSGDGQQLLLTISNRGTRVVPGLTATVTFDESLTLEEPIAEPLLPGQTRVHATRFRLPAAPRNAQRPLRYLCVQVTANATDFVEENTANNRNCLSLNEQLNVEPPFPNPATELLRVSVILPVAEAVSLRLIDQEGKIMRTHRPETTAVGLNTFLLNVKGLPVGAYVLQISYRGEQRQFRVAVGG